MNRSLIETKTVHTSLAITEAIRRTSQEKLCQELGSEALRSRRWLRCIVLYLQTNYSSKAIYLQDLIHLVLT